MNYWTSYHLVAECPTFAAIQLRVLGTPVHQGTLHWLLLSSSRKLMSALCKIKEKSNVCLYPRMWRHKGTETDRPCSVLSPFKALNWTSSEQQQHQQQYELFPLQEWGPDPNPKGDKVPNGAELTPCKVGKVIFETIIAQFSLWTLRVIYGYFYKKVERVYIDLFQDYCYKIRSNSKSGFTMHHTTYSKR